MSSRSTVPDSQNAGEFVTIPRETLASLSKYAALGRLAGDIVHEIRNPLHVLAILIDTLERQIGSDPRVTDALGNARISVERITRIVAATLSASRAGAGECRTDVRAVLDDTLTLVEATTTNKEITFRREFQDQSIPPAGVDRDVVQQVAVTLVVNATEAISAKGTVTAHLRATADGILFSIADTGTGIAPDALPHVFEAFFPPKEKGTGLGLAITRDLVTRAGGSIDVESTPGQGTTFTVCFPAA